MWRHVHDARVGGVVAVHHVVLAVHVSSPVSSLVEHVVSLVRTLVVAAVVHISILLVIAHHLVVEVTAAILLETWPVSHMVVEAATPLLARSLVELERRLEQQGEKID